MSGQHGRATGFPDGYQLVTGKLASIFNNRAYRDFPQWGFVILRGAYHNDDAEWATFLDLYEASLMDELHHFGLVDELGQHLQITVIEDRAALEGASKNAVRARFLEWVAEQRRGELARKPSVFDSQARFRYCLYVDELCLKTMTAHLHNFLNTGERWCLSDGSIVIINGLHKDYVREEPEEDEEDEEDEDDGYDQYPPIEGNTNEDVGWAYYDTIGHAELYSKLCSGGSLQEIWYGIVYRGRRPDRDPVPKYDTVRQPLSAVPRGGPYGEFPE